MDSINGQLWAANYLLKPCRPDEILEAILEVKKKILEEYAEKLQEKERIQELEISRYDVKNKRLADLILTTNEMMVSTCEEKIGYSILLVQVSLIPYSSI